VDVGKVTCLQAGNIIVQATYSNSTGVANLVCAPASFYSPTTFIDQSEEFAGPFNSWANLKTLYGAKGDGITDDTQAIQSALDQLPSTHVLYIPSGTYRITQTLTINDQQSFAIIGADPRTTSIVWGGTVGGIMLDIDGSTVFRVTRLTFDGSDSANTAEYLSDNTNGNYTTKVEFSDQHIKDIDYGIILNPGAETTVERVFFDHNHIDGLLLTTFNDINIFVDDSLFSYCGTGVSNSPGAGSFYVSNSFFDHSAKADMQIANTGNFSARHDTSVDSGGSFFAAGTIGANNAEITLQDNTVIDPAGVAVSLGDTGPLMLIDNVFRTQDINGPVVFGFDNSATRPVATSFGNIYTTSQPLSQFWGTALSYDDTTVDPDSVPTPSIPSNVYLPTRQNRAVFEVRGNDDVAIQAAINAAAASGTVKPIVHLPSGVYLINKTITLPVNSDIQLVGDEIDSTALLRMFSGDSGPMVSIPSISASVSNLTLNASTDPGRGDGLLIQMPDQPSSRIVGDQLLLQGENATSVSVDGIEQSTIDFSSLYTMGTIAGIAVSGGPSRSSGEATLGRVDYLSGSIQSQGQGVSLSVTQHGRLLVQDNWHDADASGPYNFQLTDSGTLTEQEGGVFAGPTPFVVNNFSGDVTLLGMQFKGGFDISATTNKANVLIMGMAEESGPFVAPQSSSLVTVANILDGAYNWGYAQSPSDPVDIAWLRRMFGQVRSETAVPLAGVASPITHLNRTQVLNVGTALHLMPSTQLLGHYLTVQNSREGLLTNGGSCIYTAAASEDDPTTHWMLAEGGEGDFMLVPADQQEGNGAASAVRDSGGSWVVSVEPLTPDYQQHWNVQLQADGLFRLINRGTGLALGAGSTTNPCATVTNQLGGSAAEWAIVAH
jgi:hypothetical protein